MKFKIFRSILVCSLMFVFLGLNAQDKINLTFRYTTGETYRYKTRTTFDSQQEINGKEMNASGSASSVVKIVIDSVAANGNMTFICSYESIKSSIKSGMFDTIIDQKELVGKRNRITISFLGDQIKNQVIDSVQSLNKMGFGNTTSLKADFFLHFPDHSVGMGEKWTSPINDTVKIGQGSMIYQGQFEYTLVQMEQKNGHDCCKISFTSKTETTGKMNLMGMDFFIEGSGETSGTGWYDPKLGMIIAKESKLQQDMTCAMTGQMKMTIPMSQTIITSDNLIE